MTDLGEALIKNFQNSKERLAEFANNIIKTGDVS